MKMEKLQQLDIQTVIYYHCGVFIGHEGQRLDILTSSPGAKI
jgi:hypothetical protein